MQSKSRLSSKTSEPGCKFSTERTQAQAIAIRDEYVAACKRFVYQDSDVYSMIPYTFNTCTNTHTKPLNFTLILFISRIEYHAWYSIVYITYTNVKYIYVV